jgi:YesN/AraC family two-component response regulator
MAQAVWFRVAITDGGESGLAAMNEGTFDLMIVDVFMPNMRGFESIRVFHSHAPTVPLIAISGYAFPIKPEKTGQPHDDCD